MTKIIHKRFTKKHPIKNDTCVWIVPLRAKRHTPKHPFAKSYNRAQTIAKSTLYNKELSYAYIDAANDLLYGVSIAFQKKIPNESLDKLHIDVKQRQFIKNAKGIYLSYFMYDKRLDVTDLNQWLNGILLAEISENSKAYIWMKINSDIHIVTTEDYTSLKSSNNLVAFL